jgi:hypothetical protein
MPAINPLFPRRLRTHWRSSAEALHRSAAVALMLAIFAVAATEPANAQSQTIDLSRQPVGVPPQDFEFWRASEADIGHWIVVRDAATDSSVSILGALTAFDYGKPVGRPLRNMDRTR